MKHTPRILLLLMLTIWQSLTVQAQSAEGEYTVQPGDTADLLHAIQLANQHKGSHFTIHIPDGTYDLGTRVLTRLEGNHIRLVGQSMEGTIIRNQPPIEIEGIGTTATLLNLGCGNVLEELTLQNALDYYGSGFAGRAVALQDKGDSTLCRRVRLLSHQDTYYSNNPSSIHRFDHCELHGTVDFICGDGDVFFNHCTLVLLDRHPDGSGTCVIAAPKTRPGGQGFIFSHCTVRSHSSRFSLARAWGGMPRCLYLHTVLTRPDLILPTRFTPKGMNVCEAEFLEHHTMDVDGNTVSPQSNMLTITKGEQQDTRERILLHADDIPF